MDNKIEVIGTEGRKCAEKLQASQTVRNQLYADCYGD